MAAMTTARSSHAESMRADTIRIKGRAFDPWNHAGHLLHVKGRGHIPAKPRARWVAALRRLLINISGH